MGPSVYVRFPHSSVVDGVALLIAGGGVHCPTFQSLRAVRSATDADTIVATFASAWAYPLDMFQLPLCVGGPRPGPARPSPVRPSPFRSSSRGVGPSWGVRAGRWGRSETCKDRRQHLGGSRLIY